MSFYELTTLSEYHSRAQWEIASNLLAMINNCHASKKQDIKSAKDMDPYRSYDDQKMRQRIREEIENELGRKPETIGEFIKRHQK